MEPPVFIGEEVGGFAFSHPHAIVIDRQNSTLFDLFLARNPRATLRKKNEVIKSDKYAQFVQNTRFIYFYFPWSNRIVSVLPESDFIFLKTNRNKPLISEDQQEKLSKGRIAIIGLSVGSNIAHALGLMGCGNFILCDQDNLECVNLNRLSGSVEDIGINKASLVAQRIYGNNPYAKLDVIGSEITPDLLDYYHAKQAIDIIVEEIDSLEMKIEIRRWAKRNNVAVVMLTSNVHGAFIDVERYDLNESLSILGRTSKYWTKVFEGDSLDMYKKIDIISRIVGKKAMDFRMCEALKKIGDSIVTWPQLITAGMVEGSVGAATILNIIIGDDVRQRYRRKITTV